MNEWNVGLVYQLLQKLWVAADQDGCSSSSRWRSSNTGDNNIDLVTNRCYIKMASREIMSAQCAQYYDLIVYKGLLILVDKL